MIPYWNFPIYSIGPLTLQTWGTFVALGIIVATYVSFRRAKILGLEAQRVWDLAFWIVVASFIGARLGHVLFYEPAYFAAYPGEILKIWHGGFSSFGGFLGGTLTGWLCIRRRLLRTTNYVLRTHSWLWSDTILFGLPIGWAIGRIGCFLIHDHPGTLTDFWLGVRYPDGVRHDLGLYEMFNALGLAILLFLLRNKLKVHPGLTVIIVALWYGTVRFFLDFLRAYDARYLNLTPAQYGSILLVGLGVYFLIKKKTNSPT